MKGQEAYEQKWENRISAMIENNPDKKYLAGYRNYIADMSCTTIYTYVNHIVKFIDYFKKEVEDLELDDFTMYLASIKSTSPSQQIAVYAALKQFSMYLLASGKNKTNPMQYVKRPKFKESQETIEKREKGYLEKKEISKYLAAAREGVGGPKALKYQAKWRERDILILLMFLNTGMRCSALCKLDVSNIDIENHRIIVTDKGDKVQIYDLTEDIFIEVTAWLKKRKEILDGKHEDALFISRDMTRLTPQSVTKIVKKYAENIDGKNISPHKLRATYGTQVYAASKDLYLTQQAMGHSSPKVTELYIRGQKQESRKKASDIMSKLTLK